MDFAELRRQAVDELRREGILRNAEVIRAMSKVPREEFLPPEVRSYAYADSPIPIGHGQTTSALHMTALFCEFGEMKLGQRVLEVGGGCGYMSCVYGDSRGFRRTEGGLGTCVVGRDCVRAGRVWQEECGTLRIRR